MTRLSIIIPHYNSPNLLENLIKSIPDNPEIQVIIVDDHSDAESNNLLKVIKKKYKNRNILFLENDPNKKSAGACRNKGLEYAKGKWVLFADADDYFLKNFWGIIEEYLNSHAEVVFFKPTSVELDSGKPSDRHIFLVDLLNDYLNNPGLETENRLRYFFVTPCSKLIKLEFIKKNNILFDEVIAANDVMFSTKVGFFMENFIVSEKEIYCITKSKGSLTTSLDEDKFDARVNTYIKQYKFIKDTCLSKEEFTELKKNLSGRAFLLRSLDFGIRKSLSVFRTFRKNKIHILDKSLLNPIMNIKRIGNYFYRNKKNRRFIKKI